MGMVRTTITLPEETLAQIDAIAGPRGRSAYIAEVVARQVRRDEIKRVFRASYGALKGSTTWGETDEEVYRYFRDLREEADRRMLEKWGVTEDEVPAGLDGADRPQPRAARRPRAPRVPVRQDG